VPQHLALRQPPIVAVEEAGEGGQHWPAPDEVRWKNVNSPSSAPRELLRDFDEKQPTINGNNVSELYKKPGMYNIYVGPYSAVADKTSEYANNCITHSVVNASS
jgi:hypothetical protein